MCPTVAHRNIVVSFLLANVTAGNCHGQAQQKNEQIRCSNCNSRRFQKLAYDGGVRVLPRQLIAGWKDDCTYNHTYRYGSRNRAAENDKTSTNTHIIKIFNRTKVSNKAGPAHADNSEHRNQHTQAYGDSPNRMKPTTGACVWT